ncbi:MAG: ribokinase, partial [Gammaproteobacteria bacterium]|nr:ribokinase [Gammaproteobacteria bacterium]
MPKLVNLGSLCIDHVYRVPNIADGGETVASLGHDTYPGGKGLNQSLAAARAGAQVIHVGCVGADGEWLKAELTDSGVDVGGIRVVPGNSGHAVIQVDATGQNAIVIVGAANRAVQDSDLEIAFDRLEAGDWLLIQNEINDIERVLAEAARRDVLLAFNVAPVDGREQEYDLAAVKLLIVNEIEAAALAGAGADQGNPALALERLCGALPGTDIVVTRGSDGLLYAGPSGVGSLAAFPVDAVDETGAGDAFIGYLMA